MSTLIRRALKIRLSSFNFLSTPMLTILLLEVVSLSLAKPVYAQAGINSAIEAPPQAQPAFGRPLNNVSLNQFRKFLIGKGAFKRFWGVSEGLGPVFNHESCSICHDREAPGGGGSTNRDVTRFGFTNSTGVFDPLTYLGGSLLQERSINATCAETIPPQANTTANRVALPLFGFGLVEALADSTLAALANNPPPGISGRVHWVPLLENPAVYRAGRFGWKSQIATVFNFSGDATLNELGITNRLLPNENAPNGDQNLLQQCDAVPDPEDTPNALGTTFIERVTDFQRLLAPPPQTPKSGTNGEQLFTQVGCANCHTPRLTTANSFSVESIFRNVTLKPYSDFLLHDVGTGDNIGQGFAAPNELRTPPLWGITGRRFSLLHDGSASNYSEAIDRHAGEAAASRQIYYGLSTGEQASLQSFLDSLGKREFDVGTAGAENNRIDINDFYSDWNTQQGFKVCFETPTPIGPDDPCAIHDVNQNLTVDLQDFGVFLTQAELPTFNQRCTDRHDLEEILLGIAPDSDQNGVPDDAPAPIHFSGPTQAAIGESMLYGVSGLPPGTRVHFFGTLRGVGFGPQLSPSICSDLIKPVYLESKLINTNGSVQFTVPIPPAPIELVGLEFSAQVYTITNKSAPHSIVIGYSE